MNYGIYSLREKNRCPCGTLSLWLMSQFLSWTQPTTILGNRQNCVSELPVLLWVINGMRALKHTCVFLEERELHFIFLNMMNAVTKRKRPRVPARGILSSRITQHHCLSHPDHKWYLFTTKSPGLSFCFEDRKQEEHLDYSSTPHRGLSAICNAGSFPRLFPGLGPHCGQSLNVALTGQAEGLPPFSG